jgi:hypothetical protein
MEAPMALITCSECRHKISDKVLSCPSCGIPFTPEKIAEIKKKELQAKKNRGLGCLSVIVFIAVLQMISKFSFDKPNDSTKADLIPYSSLSFDGGKDAKVLDLMGWVIGKQIHEKYGFQSHQQAIIEYTKILGHKKVIVDKYLGKPLNHDNENEYTYKANFGYVKVDYDRDISSRFSIIYTIDFKGYFDVLRSIGIYKFKRPFGVNDFALMYNSNLGNSLVEDNGQSPFVNIILSLPNPSTTPYWRVSLIR